MAKHIEYDGKHLTLSQRILIEKGLNDKQKLIEISITVQKDPRGISREIQNHRLHKTNNRNPESKKIAKPCKQLSRFPYVCNGCNKKKVAY